MNIRQKILIDRLAGKPPALVLNVAARVLSFFLRRNHALHGGFRRIVICKFVGMGSIIQLTPLVRTLRANYPQARITFVTSESNRGLTERLGLIDNLITINDENLFLLLFTAMRALFRLWRFRAEMYLDFELFSNFSSVLATMSCAKNRIGFFKSSFAYRSGIYNYLVYFNMKAPVSEVFLQSARLVGCTTLIRDLHKIEVREEDRAALKASLPFSPREKYIVVNPNASDLRVERRWDGARFAQLMEKTAEAFPHRIGLIGVKSEAAYTAGIRNRVREPLRGRIDDLSGRLSLGALFALLEGAELLISNDTGPMHIAFALRKKTVTLWGPGLPLQYGDAVNSISIHKNVYCSPCIYEFDVPPCKGDNQCMKAISVDDVFEAIVVTLGSAPAAHSAPDNMIYTRNGGHYPLGIVIK
jgi:ADP-heptose:LPS heptosyltransferase